MHLKDALEKCGSDTLESKLKLVKDVFLTHRQVGESEAYYKLFPFLHLSGSNIGTTFVPTGFPQNRSHFLKQIDADSVDFYNDIVTVPEKEGKFYNEKDRLVINQWLMAQMGTVGPMIGQHHQFHYYHQGKSEWGEERYFKITRKIYEDLETRLAQSKFLAKRCQISMYFV